MAEEHPVTPRETEADARVAIDDLLRQAGWDPRDKSMVGTEVQAAPSTSTVQQPQRPCPQLSRAPKRPNSRCSTSTTVS